MKRIIITGGLGYIGTELCKIYSGFSWNDKITVLDNRFISERVNQLRNWNMDFLQGDILDKDMVKKNFKDADIVHHLAGVTNVPRTKSEEPSPDGIGGLLEYQCFRPPRWIWHDGWQLCDFDLGKLRSFTPENGP